MAEGVRGRKPSSGERALLAWTGLYRAALANGIGGQIADHYRQLPVIGGWLGDQIGGADRYLIDPRNRAFAFVFSHYIYTLDGGGQP